MHDVVIGGGHGGNGGASGAAGKSYDSVFTPSLPGSSGASSPYTSGGAGGGVIKIVTDSLIVNGTISTNGASSPGSASGGGAGGSILIQTSQLMGAGLIAANGGNGGGSYGSAVSGGGAGGRIAIYYLNSSNFYGLVQAYGGTGSVGYGGPGTIFYQISSYKKLVIDNNNSPVVTSVVTNPDTNSGLAYLTDPQVYSYPFSILLSYLPCVSNNNA